MEHPNMLLTFEILNIQRMQFRWILEENNHFMEFEILYNNIMCKYIYCK